EFMEMLVGVGAARVRDLFAQAKKSSPAIIFIDEVESIGRMRGMGFSGGHDEREQTLNQILVEMDGFAPNDNVIVTAATNRPDLLDPALTRPGRFDRRVSLDLPDIEGRKAIIKIHMKGKPFAKEVDIERIAKRTVGFSGADLANMLNEAAILAARETRKEITNLDLEEAATKVKLGPQRHRMQSAEEKKMTAYHEGGHAVVAHYLPHTDPVHRISIVSRGSTGGHTLVPPSIDRYTETKTRLLERIAVLLGGRAAEELIFKEVTTGASSDLEIASAVAREMVTDFGMSPLGPTIFSPRAQFGMIPQTTDGAQVSPEQSAKIDREIAKIIDEGFKKAKETIVKHRSKLDLVADTLLEKETLERDEFERLVGKPVTNGEVKFRKARPAKVAHA
ncbi:MAG TPA: AAA family ATPase, partial [Candidatus Saccharimonadales bacterium]|nr:AAA family ATPase [Candidatus Saccharimonadales bacterium]